MATVEVCLRFRFYSISTGTLHGSTKFQGFLKHLEMRDVSEYVDSSHRHVNVYNISLY